MQVYVYYHGTSTIWAFSPDFLQWHRQQALKTADPDLVSHGWISQVEPYPHKYIDREAIHAERITSW